MTSSDDPRERSSLIRADKNAACNRDPRASLASDPERDAIVAEPPRAAVDMIEAMRARDPVRLDVALSDLRPLVDAAERSKALEAIDVLTAEAEVAPDVVTLADVGAQARALMATVAAQPRPTRTALSAMLDAPPPVTPWICEGLQWCPGRPPMIIGYPGSGKTIAVLSAAVDLMLGRPIWGCRDFLPAHACRVLLADFDQGEAPTRKRIRRLLAGMCVTRSDLESARAEVEERRGEPCPELFEVETSPRLRLVADKVNAAALEEFERAWCGVVAGFDVVIVDSLRKLAPLLEENDSRFGEVPEALRRVSERTGVTLILVHHAGRARADKGKPITESGRGSSAVDGASGSQLVITNDDGRRRVALARESAEADRPAPAPFYLQLVRTEDAEHGRGYRLDYEAAEAKPTETRGGEAKVAGARSKALDVIRRETMKGKGVPGVAYLATCVSIDRGVMGPIVAELIEACLVENVPEKRGRGAPKAAFWALPAPDFRPPPRPRPAEAPPTDTTPPAP